ncbi:PAAR domain-containing protein [Acinetobacter guerrae]|uniref:PAAR domain-containing protein n=1 Tax=Acinetobacter guerrae TaxID=1843371 RepID=UPI00128BC965|nr:PAAR domain-containing protein [Acinetobacter guerrae]MPW45514.1 hypothetical protein [Acinetobacter guerrae]
MAKGFAIHNAPTNHGGIVPSTQMRSSQQGNLFVRAGDGHFCPKCKCWSTVIKSHDHIIIDGKSVAYAGDKLTCGATIQPQQSHVVGDSGSYYSHSQNSNTMNNFVEQTKKQYGQKFLIVDEETGKPLINVCYEISMTGIVMKKGHTDGNGYTEAITSENPDEIEINILSEGEHNDYCCKR